MRGGIEHQVQLRLEPHLPLERDQRILHRDVEGEVLVRIGVVELHRLDINAGKIRAHSEHGENLVRRIVRA